MITLSTLWIGSESMSRIDLFRPQLGEEELEAVKDVFASCWIGLGPTTSLFESEFAKFIGVPYAIATNSCTSALDLAMRLLGVGPGDEVIVPTITFVSTAHAVAYNGARPVFCDVDPDTMLLDTENAMGRVTTRTKAIVIVHYGGRMADVVSLRERLDAGGCEGVAIIEDCAHACGSQLDGRMAGSVGDIGCFSFQAVKNLVTGDGGMLTISNKDFADRAKRLRWLGINKGTWDRSEVDRSYWWEYNVDEIGLKCHMNDIQAAIGRVQLRKLPEGNNRRAEIARHYESRLSFLSNNSRLRIPPGDSNLSFSSWHLYPIQISNRDDLAELMDSRKISTGVHYKPIHLYGCYGYQPPLPNAEMVWKLLLSLPMHLGLSDDDIDMVCNTIIEFCNKV